MDNKRAICYFLAKDLGTTIIEKKNGKSQFGSVSSKLVPSLIVGNITADDDSDVIVGLKSPFALFQVFH